MPGGEGAGVTTSHPAPGARPLPPAPPGYKILNELGQGGMGKVYKAVDLKLKRVVALKMILAGAHADRDKLRRFHTEAEAVARLRHPNIVQIYEIGEDGGCPFMALEFIADGNLEQRVAATPQPPRQAAALIATLCRAMHAVHQRSVIHRDLKPANILLARKDDVPATAVAADLPLDSFEPKIADFGLAKQLGDDGITQTGVPMGTPSYMSPEQALGKKEIGAATDIYSLAAVLYRMLTGRPPFVGGTTRDTLEQVATGDPVPPTRLQPRTPRALETICLKGLDKDPAKRYATAGAMADDLARFLDGRSILARPAPPWQAAAKWARRRPLQAALTGALLLALVGMATSGVLYGQNQRKEANIAKKDAKIAQQATELEKQERENVENALGRLREATELLASGQELEDDDFEEALKKYESARTLLRDDTDQSAQDLRVKIDVRIEHMRKALEDRKAENQFLVDIQQLDKIYNDVRLHEIDFLEKDAPSNRKHIIAEAKKALTLLGIAPDQSGLARFIENIRRFRPKEWERDAARCYQLLLAWAEAEASSPPDAGPVEKKNAAVEALRLLDRAKELKESCPQMPEPEEYSRRRARYEKAAGNPNAAPPRGEMDKAKLTPLDNFLAALVLYRLPHGLEEAAARCNAVLSAEPDNYWAQFLLAACLSRAGRWKEAKIAWTACLGRNPPGFDFWPRLLLASAHSQLREFREADEEFGKAIALAADDLQRAAVLTSSGVNHLRQRRWEEAESDLKRAKDLRPALPQAPLNLAQVYQERAKYYRTGSLVPQAAAKELRRRDLDRALDTLDEALESHPTNAVPLYLARSQLRLARNQAKAARNDIKAALDVARESADKTQLAIVLAELASVQNSDRDYTGALASCDAAREADPLCALVHLRRAEILLHKRDDELLRARAQPANSQDVEIRLVLKGDSQISKALEAYLSSPDFATAPPELKALHFITVADYYSALEEYPKALKALDSVLELIEDSATRAPTTTRIAAATRIARGKIYLRLGRHDSARTEFREAHRLDRTSAEALVLHGRACVLLGEGQSGVDRAEQALELGPQTTPLLFNAACVYAGAAIQLESKAQRGSNVANALQANRYREQAVNLLRKALAQETAQGEDHARKFWSTVRDEPVLRAMQERSADMQQLAKNMGAAPRR
jgi:tetratricopeptide (TPR) repeat protein